MPILAECEDKDAIEFDEFIEYLLANKIDTTDHDAMLEVAPMLKKLSNNRQFLSNRIASELKDYRSFQGGNRYSAPVFMLYGPHYRNQSFFVRACFWPPKQHRLVQLSGTDAFFYHTPHDHNFNFLTVGYFGPGYWSNYYLHAHRSTVGFPGEKVKLKFVERSRLSEGKLMLYRAFVDVHDQLPADSMSVSLNILENSVRVGFMDQCCFNLKDHTFKNPLNTIGADALFDVFASCGSDEDRAVLKHIADHHGSNRVRWCAWKALTNAARTPEGAIATLLKVPDTAPELVRRWASHRIHRLDVLFNEEDTVSEPE